MPSFSDRYRAAGLERNAFAASSNGAYSVDTFVSRGLPDPPPPGSRTLVQVIGPSGYGKTSHVNHWRSRTPGPYHYIPRRPYSARWHQPPMGDIVYGDEIDRMPVIQRRRWFRQLARDNATLVIGTHVDLRSLGRRSGFDVITQRLTPIDRLTLEQFTNRRLAAVAIGDTSSVRFSSAELDLIMGESQGVPGEAEVICHRLLAERVA